ncbi:ATPase with role in protein import into the ER [Lunasporangiospora selenospora]|uniref:ATPase with role in protein import into the ER n=1 Tax=Lunasporangiospora selenospora TaxID=979761 RepID=A0A9P6FN01_9FUNG|nr:ATPase with role in protein import into the ER [Lunasporangiospora selenospora]
MGICLSRTVQTKRNTCTHPTLSSTLTSRNRYVRYITAKYLYELVASAESIVGQAITSITIVLPDGQNIRTTAKEILNDRLKGNYTLYDHFNSGRASRFEVSVHEVDGGSYETVSSIYDQNLGGNDFNRLVIDHLLLVHKNKTGQDLRNDETFLNRLGSEVEYAKRVLSVQDWAQIDIESLQPGGQDLSEMLTRSQFEDVNMVLFNKTIMAIDQVLKESLMYTKDDIQDVVFSGGSAKVPFLQSAIREYFGSHPKYHGSDHSEDTVVLGAAKLAHWFQDRRHFDGAVCCFGVTPSTIGIKTADGAMFTFTDRDSDFLEINKMFTFSTAMDNQDRVVVRVFREDEERADQNVFLGGVELTGLAPAPKGDPKIRVRITSYSCGNYINLNVMDVATGRINGSIFTLSQPFLHDYGEEFQYAMLEEGSAEIKAAGEMILLPGN